MYQNLFKQLNGSTLINLIVAIGLKYFCELQLVIKNYYISA